ncbi:MAG: hypothetical protein J6M47_00090 [Clostridia bacterium]|nr:hypothetical protein [Clostridia bacterium]
MNKKMLIAALLCALMMCSAAFAETIAVTTETAAAAPQVGEFYLLGSYEQDNNLENGAEPIEWRVLKIEGDEALIISKYALDARPYNDTVTYSNWSKCTLRTWLNEEFLNTAFTAEEQQQLITKELKNWEDVKTTDTVFLLDNDQAKRLFSSHDDRQALPTAYAAAQGAYRSVKYGLENGGNSQWWLRTISWVTRRRASYVAGSGGVMTCGGETDGRVENERWGVRPAVYVKLSALTTK